MKWVCFIHFYLQDSYSIKWIEVFMVQWVASQLCTLFFWNLSMHLLHVLLLLPFLCSHNLQPYLYTFLFLLPNFVHSPKLWIIPLSLNPSVFRFHPTDMIPMWYTVAILSAWVYLSNLCALHPLHIASVSQILHILTPTSSHKSEIYVVRLVLIWCLLERAGNIWVNPWTLADTFFPNSTVIKPWGSLHKEIPIIRCLFTPCAVCCVHFVQALAIYKIK